MPWPRVIEASRSVVAVTNQDTKASRGITHPVVKGAGEALGTVWG